MSNETGYDFGDEPGVPRGEGRSIEACAAHARARRNGTDRSARQTLVEATGSPFAPGPETKPVVDVLDGRKRNGDLDPEAWIRALEATDGAVAIYFGLAADHEWWLAYNPGGQYPDEFDGPYLLWTTYPSGPWDLSALPRGILEHHQEDAYGTPDCDREREVYRSRVVCLEDAPAFVRWEVSNRE